MLPQFRQTRHAADHALPKLIDTRIKTTDITRTPLNRRCMKPRYIALADINLNLRASSLVSDHHELHNGLQINP
jgi:hypothetical protein